ncbi:hypothetical protein Ae717Ps2_6123c [Pseudonocardia sp. Ae717_Ps2]|uniref:hypothetical protein n=1 Tax=Pseudonocardia sp. Ae717_Ps2 TaxID=1885573 RepID=UPI00094B44CA|nr:hypothetical protein [Pseudonocardia sp. Ae717_Ps2]OLM27756.1 hypothetical protein Ae717Ps2_6974c [Pseudonocardia sp. Ae717_Ps2]OLM28128.1 hypothetical protein Ae717Ps2_6756 [Pseudonocardia sp. Ae717_Ps2]OLM28804.1 hypothetical protein Ae717Ps2_6123c [Pseudonocardia sp. Ae717_Ps2]
MWKKTGIVVAASAASLMALSPVAMAHGTHSGDHGDGIDKSAEGLIAGLNGNNINVPIQACNNNIPLNLVGLQVPIEDAAAANGLTGALGILGSGTAKSGDSVTDQSDNCAQAGAAGDTVKGHK